MKVALSPKLVCLLISAPLWAGAATLLLPTQDDAVVEVLQSITRHRLPLIASVQAAGVVAVTAVSAPDAVTAAQTAQTAQTVRQHIAMARQTGDTRYWGRAQAALAPWWDKPQAPADLAILQATVQQGRHEFDASRQVLTAALARAPRQAQGWLNLAALERLSARYAASLAACDAVARAGQAFYAQACRLETQSLQGEHRTATQGLQRLLAQTKEATSQSWLWSLLAESQERAGHGVAAAQAYRHSLALDADLYTTIAYSDLLLRTAQPQRALAALSAAPETDAVLLRRAAAWRKLHDARWRSTRTVLAERAAEVVRRGDDPTLHGRELALAALWLDDDAPQALSLAQANLKLQREPLDWWVALRSAQQAKNTAAVAQLRADIVAIGLHDQRLDIPTQPQTPKATR